MDTRSGQWQGVRDTFENWWLVIRVAWLGRRWVPFRALVLRSSTGSPMVTRRGRKKGAEETFGKGDIRGVLASEGSNNAKEGGALVPTIAFGVPGSASMAILLRAFLIHGLILGPDMLTKNLT